MSEQELRELDVQVARAIGWAQVREVGGGVLYGVPADGNGDAIHPLPEYSTSADAALSAYEVMRRRGWHFLVSRSARLPDTGASASLFRGPEDKDAKVHRGATVAEALCRAIVAAAALEATNA